MEKVIKVAHARESGVTDYERNALEAVNAGPHGGRDYVDPAAILAEARAEAEQKVQEAHAEGMRRGIQNGEEQFRESVAASAQLLQSAAAALHESRESFLESAQDQVARLAYAIAARILRREAQVAPELVQTTVRAALERLLDQERVLLHVNPRDLEAIREHQITLLDDFDSIKELDLVSDEEVEPGGCVAETDRLHVNTQLQAQLEQLMERIDD